MTNIRRLAIPDVLLITPPKHGDARGFFSETYKARELAEAGFTPPFVQDNHSCSGARGTVRGLHFQAPPRAQDKLIRVVRGAIYDVAVDIRRGSPTYGRHVAAELSAENWSQLLIPAGFAHGFQTLTETAEVLYKVSDDYAPETEQGLLWDDPDLGIDWPIGREAAFINGRDAAWPGLAELRSPFSSEN
jgi:dTDP-4-dehydrorhamnose 3,5-epimerase